VFCYSYQWIIRLRKTTRSKKGKNVAQIKNIGIVRMNITSTKQFQVVWNMDMAKTGSGAHPTS